MIVHDVEQGTEAWFALRLGIPTASEFDKIITPARGTLSSQARDYAIRLVTETLLNRPLETHQQTEWMKRGRDMEAQAAALYELAEDVQLRQVGFCTTDDRRVGASPDRLIVGGNGGVEIKCPAPHTHMGYLLDGFGDAYKVQAQGQLYVCELDYVDRYSFHPEMPPMPCRTYRDEPFIAKMQAALAQFLDMRDEMLERARAAGDYTRSERVQTPTEQEYANE